MTGQHVSDRARAMLDDDGATSSYRFKATEIIMWINDGIRTIWRNATDSHYASDGTLTAYAEITGLTDTLILDDKYRDAMAHYVASMMLRRKSGEADNMNRMSAHTASFKALTGISIK